MVLSTWDTFTSMCDHLKLFLPGYLWLRLRSRNWSRTWSWRFICYETGCFPGSRMLVECLAVLHARALWFCCGLISAPCSYPATIEFVIDAPRELKRPSALRINNEFFFSEFRNPKQQKRHLGGVTSVLRTYFSPSWIQTISKHLGSLFYLNCAI